MNKKIEQLIASLEELETYIDEAEISEEGFNRYGWNYPHLYSSQIVYFVNNTIAKLKMWKDDEIPSGLQKTIDAHIAKVDDLTKTVKTYYTDTASHIIHIVNIIINTLVVISNDIDFELFSFEEINNKKLLPKSLTARLRSYKTQVDKISESTADLKDKIKTIHDAHETAESLPTDLESLKEARRELSASMKSADLEISATEKKLEQILKLASESNNKISVQLEAANKKIEKIKECNIEAANLVSQCDEALQITTTQGLAAGFDQKAHELKASINTWVIWLLVALISGGAIGIFRVDALTKALEQDLTAGQAILHSIMSILSISGSFWLAWIATRQITQRFKLSEDYSYKATVAKSFTGFKKFAGKFDDETEERLFNSTLDRLDEMPLRLIDSKDYNSPWHEFTDSESFREALRIVPNLAKEAGKFANKTSIKSKFSSKQSNKPQVDPTKPANDQPETSAPKEQENS